VVQKGNRGGTPIFTLGYEIYRGMRHGGTLPVLVFCIPACVILEVPMSARLLHEDGMLHIGFLTSEYIIPPTHLDGGLATYIQKVSRGLVERGHQVSVFCLSDRNFDWIDEGVCIHEVLDVSLRKHDLLNDIIFPTAKIEEILENSSKLAKRLLEVNTQDPLDIIQAASYQAVGIAMCNNGSIPLITRISSLAPLYRNSNVISKNANTLSAALTDWCETYQIENSDCSFAPSALMAKHSSLLSHAVPHVIRSPIDRYNENLDESFFNQNLKGMKYLLFFGTLNRMKGIEIISRSVGGLLEEFPDLHFVFVGRTHLAGDHQSFADKIIMDNEKWKNNLHYYKSLSKQKLYPVIRHAFGVLIPSLIDNYPNTCLEAMQFGKIVIGTYESSLDEMIVNGETGILVQKNDVESLQAGIRNLLVMSIDQRSEMEARIRRNFDEIIAEDRIGQLINLYHETIITYQPKTDEELSWEMKYLKEKLRKNLRIGIIPGTAAKISQIWKYFCNFLFTKVNK
jgi:glycosyltransferase involved in cell wall biosynthesis